MICLKVPTDTPVVTSVITTVASKGFTSDGHVCGVNWGRKLSQVVLEYITMELQVL